MFLIAEEKGTILLPPQPAHPAESVPTSRFRSCPCSGGPLVPVFAHAFHRRCSSSTIPFRIRTSAKRACNSRRICTSKTHDLKPFRMCTYEKTGEGGTGVHVRQALCEEFAVGLGIRIERNSHGDRALAARRKFPLSHRLFGGICQRRVSAQHLHILHRPIRVDGNL